MAKNFCPICGTALVPGLDACPNCGRRIEPDEPDRMAEPPQVQAQDGTRDAGQSGQESGGAPAADLPESPVREAGAGEPRQAGRLDEPPVTVPAGEIPTQPGPGAPVPPIHGQEEAYPYPPQGGSPVGAAPRPIYMPPRPEGTPGPGVPPPAYAQRPAYYTPGMQSYGQPELPEPISMGSYLGMSLLGMVPVIGLVFLLVWALDSPGRPNRRNFARGFLAARVIAWAVFFCIDVRAVFDNGGGVPGFLLLRQGKKRNGMEREAENGILYDPFGGLYCVGAAVPASSGAGLEMDRAVEIVPRR